MTDNSSSDQGLRVTADPSYRRLPSDEALESLSRCNRPMKGHTRGHGSTQFKIDATERRPNAMQEQASLEQTNKKIERIAAGVRLIIG